MKFSWLTIAENERGVKEMAGSAANPRIIQYHATTKLKATSDEVPWCSSFVNWVMSQAKYPTTRSAAAKSWADYGREAIPQLGVIAVFRRQGGNHVGFYYGETATGVRVLGGNQSNEVNVRLYRKSDLIGYRLPNKLNADDQRVHDALILGMATKATKGIV